MIDDQLKILYDDDVGDRELLLRGEMLFGERRLK